MPATPWYPPQQPSGPELLGWTRASLGRRVLAFLVDLALAGVVPIVVVAVIGAAATPAPTLYDPNPSPPAWIGLWYVLWFGFFVWWFTWGEGRPAGQTVGKQWLGVRVVRVRDGEPLGYGHAFGRTMTRYLSLAIFGLGYLWALWDPQQQTFHDKVANTYVIDARVPRRASADLGPLASYAPVAVQRTAI